MKRTVIAVGLIALLFALAAQAQTPAPKPGPEHKKLEAWVGSWTIEGLGKDNSSNPEYKVVWTVQARWILDGFFVEFNHLEKYQGKESRSLEIVGYDPVKKSFTSRIFRQNGTVDTCPVVLTDRTWVISGTSITDDGKQEKWSCAWTLSPDATSLSGKCDTEKENAKWTSFAGKGTKAKAR